MTELERAIEIIRAWSIMGALFMSLRFIVGVVIDRSRWKEELACSAITWLVAISLLIMICIVLIV